MQRQQQRKQKALWRSDFKPLHETHTKCNMPDTCIHTHTLMLRCVCECAPFAIPTISICCRRCCCPVHFSHCGLIRSHTVACNASGAYIIFCAKPPLVACEHVLFAFVRFASVCVCVHTCHFHTYIYCVCVCRCAYFGAPQCSGLMQAGYTRMIACRAPKL